MLSPPPLFPADTTKFFGCELGAQTKHDAASGMSIVNGAHETAKLQQLLEGFIKTFVQCYACHNPETVMAIDKDDPARSPDNNDGFGKPLLDLIHPALKFILVDLRLCREKVFYRDRPPVKGGIDPIEFL